MSFLKFWKKKKDKSQTDTNLSKLGLTTITDEKFGARTELYEEFSSTIQASYGLEGESSDILNEIIERINKINNILHQAAIPYGRAGSIKGYAKLTNAWAEIYARTLDVSLTVRKALTNIDKEEDSYQPEVQKAELVLKLRFLFEFCYLKYALKLASVSWFKEDVSPSWAITVHAPPQPHQGYPPTSGDRPLDASRQLQGQSPQLNWGEPRYPDDTRKRSDEEKKDDKD